MKEILRDFLCALPLFVKLYLLTLVLAAFSALFVWMDRDWEVAGGMFLVVALLSLIPVLGVHSYYKGSKGLFYTLSLFCLLLWIPFSLFGLSDLWLVLLWIVAPFLLVRLFFDKSLGHYFLLVSCVGAFLSINIVAVFLCTLKVNAGKEGREGVMGEAEVEEVYCVEDSLYLEP